MIIAARDATDSMRVMCSAEHESASHQCRAIRDMALVPIDVKNSEHQVRNVTREGQEVGPADLTASSGRTAAPRNMVIVRSQSHPSRDRRSSRSLYLDQALFIVCPRVRRREGLRLHTHESHYVVSSQGHRETDCFVSGGAAARSRACPEPHGYGQREGAWSPAS